MNRIDNVIVFVIDDETDGCEAVPAFESGGIMWPLICTTRIDGGYRLELLKKAARAIATETGKEIRVMRFGGVPELVETIKPKDGG